MSYGGGKDCIDLAPLDYAGSRDLDTMDESMGCHVGKYEGLNILNPQPGWHYHYVPSTPEAVLGARQGGGRIATTEDPELSAYNAMVGADETPLDSHVGFPGLLLVKTPIERERQRRQEIAERAHRMLKGSEIESAFASRGHRSPEEQQYANGKPLRFVQSKHMFRVTDGSSESDPSVDAWTATGIVRED